MDQLPEDNRERLEQSTASTSGAASPAATSSSKEESGQKPAEPSSSSSAVPTVPTPAATGTASSATDSALTTVKGKEGLDDDLDLLAPILGALGDDEGTLESASTATDKNTSLSTGRKKADVIDLLQSSKGRRRRSALDEPEAPHRPKSAYTLFTETLIKDGYLGTAKMVSAKWRALSNEDHYKFDELALADKARYQEDIKKYFGNKGQDLMSVLMQCSTDTGPSKRQREESDHPVAPQKRAARSADEDALADLFDMGDDDNDSSRGASQPAEVQAPQLRLDASGKIIVDAASLQASTSNALRGVSTISSSAMPFEQAYKRTKRMKWTEEEDARFWKAVSAYGSDFLLIQTLMFGPIGLKLKFKSEEKSPYLRGLLLDYS
eukprot:GEMP01037540.1.p1 GENE.GEMP01037540.1~~GEMP01037540.1.p1  ORF type:complete len:380 (+),score=71.98 GEMP01037540.1:54-1193(+)